MAADLDFQTATMAKVFADQGHYEKAADIYRNLLKRDPTRQDLADALSAVEEHLPAAGSSSDENIGLLLGEWIELVFKYKRLRFLKSVKKRI